MTTAEVKEQIERLRDTLGRRRHLLGTVEVDQVYAHYQHEHPEFHHPRGGIPFYLTVPLMAGHRAWLEEIARGMLRDGGKEGMRAAMEQLSDAVEVTAPREFSDLRRSGHPKVMRGQVVLYDRAPHVGRLTEQELRAKSRLRWPSLPDRLKGWIYWHNTARGRAGLPPPRRSRGRF